MRHTVMPLLFFLIFSVSFAQEIEQKSIYIQFIKRNDCSEILKFYHREEGGIVFNFYCSKSESFIYKNGSDTLSISKLKNYKFSTPKEIKKLEDQWQVKNKKALIKKYGDPYPPFDKNGIFKVYLIEVINNEKFVIYPVEWRSLTDIAN